MEHAPGTRGSADRPLGLRVDRRRLMQGTGLTALAALVAACTPGSSGSSGSAGSSAPGSTGSPAASGAAPGWASVQEIDLLSVGLPASMSNLYPGKEAGVVNFYVASLVGEGLVAPDGVGVLRPAIATG